MGAVAKVGLVLSEQTKVGFVDEGGGLEGVIGTLPAQITFGDAAQLAIGDGEKPVERIFFTSRRSCVRELDACIKNLILTPRFVPG